MTFAALATIWFRRNTTPHPALKANAVPPNIQHDIFRTQTQMSSLPSPTFPAPLVFLSIVCFGTTLYLMKKYDKFKL